MIDKNFYDKEYFESGLSSKKSCYLNYRWMPDLTIPMAFYLMQELGITPGDCILDYGCSKGYLVKALRLLGVNAYGVDISEYAIKNCDAEVKDFCFLINDSNPTPPLEMVDYIISKDVLEHMDTESIHKFLENYKDLSNKQYHIIPLGDNEKYRIDEYHLDRSHIQINNEQWWIDIFQNHNWNINLKHNVTGIKENWQKQHPTGNGFFKLSK